jgi:hypothetical protein
MFGIPYIDFKAPPRRVIDYKYFYDVAVSTEVQHVFQAASVHDRFAPFQPCPVRRNKHVAAAEAAGEAVLTGSYPGVKFTTQEVWYPGTRS